MAQTQVLEPGLEVSTFAEGLDAPVAMEFAPDGRLFVAEVGGDVRIVRPEGTLEQRIFAHVDVYTENENGLLGLALDPDFASNGFVYVFATVTPFEQRILRFADPAIAGVDSAVIDGSSEVLAGEPVVIRGNLPTRGEFHSGGGLKVGPDGKLYFGIGDNLVVENSQDITTLAGKISRINLDGSVPSDNPFVTPTGTPRAVYALGFRNPFRFCFAPDGRMFVMDVGSDGDGRREEINLVQAGGNFGWPIVEGRQDDNAAPRFVQPIHDYRDGGAAPVGAVFYTGSHFPERYLGNLFHLEYVLSRLYRVVLDGDRVVSHTLLVQGDGGPVDLAQGPDGALYWSEIHTGKIQRLSATAAAGEVVAGDQAEGAVNDPTPHAAPLCGFGTLTFSVLSLVGLAGRRISCLVVSLGRRGVG